jgi:hypothetical protein
MLKTVDELSSEFQNATAILDSGWSGTYGDLAVKLGRTSRSALLAVRMVRSYVVRHPSWNASAGYKKN